MEIINIKIDEVIKNQELRIIITEIENLKITHRFIDNISRKFVNKNHPTF